MTKYSPSIEFEETEISIPSQATETGIITGMVLNADMGYGKTITDIYSVSELLEQFGKPTDFNYKNWFNARDYLMQGNHLKVVRPVPTNAKNSSMQLNGVSHLSLDSDWYNGTDVKNRTKPIEAMYNKDVAEFNLESNFTTTNKLEIINRFVTTKQDLSIAVCSSADHYEEPMFFDEIGIIRNFNQTQAPLKPVKDERYTILRKTEAVNITAGSSSPDIIVSPKDLTNELSINDYINDGTSHLLITAIDYGVTTIDVTTISVAEGTSNDSSIEISYLLGDWSTSNFDNGDLVEYDLDTTNWVIQGSPADKYYIELLGKVYRWDDPNWVVSEDEKYLPVDSNGDGKAEYAVKDIFDSSLLNSDNSIKSFKDIYKANLDFVDEYDLVDSTKLLKDNVLIFVFKKNDISGKWQIVEQHLGSSVRTAKDDNNNSIFLEKVVFQESNYIYVKTGETNTHTVTNVGNIITATDLELKNFQIGEKIKFIDTSGAEDIIKIASITNMSYAGDDTIITVNSNPTLSDSTITKITDEVSGKVSTNYSKYGNPRSASYDDNLSYHNSEGFSITDLIIYDLSPQDSDSVTITDYANLSTTDIESSADVFLDKDNVDVNILIPFETIDEFGNHHQDKMANIANTRKDCYAIIVPFDESLFLGQTEDEITESLVEEFGNQRANLFSGTFTQFGKYTGVNQCSMKYYEDTYNNKFRWLTYAGDIARMMKRQDSTKGVWFPIAGSPDGTINNHIKTAFIPKEDFREELNKNAINTMYINSSMSNPILFSNLTSYRTEGLFQVLSYRLMLNKIETFVKNNLFPQLFKFKSDNMKKRIKDLINPFLSEIKNSGGLDSFELIFPVIKGEKSNEMNIMLKLVPAGVVEHFYVSLEMSEAGFEITEI